MAEYFHGVSTRQVDTSVSTPVTADSGIAFVVGAAPAHTVGGSVNDPDHVPELRGGRGRYGVQ